LGTELAVAANGAGITAFRALKSLQAALLLNGGVRLLLPGNGCNGGIVMRPVLRRAVILVAFVASVGCADVHPPGRPTARAKDELQGAKSLTHLGQPAGEYVILEVVGGMKGGCGPAKIDFVRVLPDGGTEAGPGGLGYRIPEGKLLVVTDVDWQYVHPKGAEGAAKIQILRLSIESLAKPGSSRRAFESTVTLSSQGEGGTSQSMTSGFIVSSKARICPDVFPGPLGPPSGLQHLIVRGYLIAEK
jgi:hypothetical protein